MKKKFRQLLTSRYWHDVIKFFDAIRSLGVIRSFKSKNKSTSSNDFRTGVRGGITIDYSNKTSNR